MSAHDSAEQAASQRGKDYAVRLWQYKQAETVSAMIYLGRRLGLFKALAGIGPITASELAKKTDLHERWLLEWLRLLTAAKVLDYVDETRFELPAEGAELLANENSRQFMLDNFDGGISSETIEGLVRSFETGIGRTYEEAGPEGAHRSEARHIRAVKNQVVPLMIPALEGVHEKLESGCFVADVGCGDGALVIAMAERYPNSRFQAYEPNVHAVEHVRSLVENLILDNVEVIHAPGEALAQGAIYDLVITFDCIHDMTRPDVVMRAIRQGVKEDGTWFIKDIRSKPRFEDNLRNPMLAMMYGFSLLSCMSSAMSEQGGAGLGTLGFNPEVAQRMSADAGFSRFTMHDFKDPGNLYYEVRP
jgi:2-polyprenyl-3-methyl-5-hydroxy-6-metoxy-1,4-benzoquinol methylase